MCKIEMMNREEFEWNYGENVGESVERVYVGVYDDGEDCEVTQTFGYVYANKTCCLSDGLQYTLCDFETMMRTLIGEAEAIEKIL